MLSTMMFDDKNLGNIICSMISGSSVRRNSSNMISASSGGINKLSKIDQIVIRRIITKLTVLERRSCQWRCYLYYLNYYITFVIILSF